jgi:cyclophilin family peptidyl-prolyl cis-trans isomerase/HEAT repeat protein
MKNVCLLLAFIVTLAAATTAQIPVPILVRIVKAEDSRSFNKTLEDLIKDRNPAISERAALGAGRIGDEAAIPTLTALLTSGSSVRTRAMAAFAIGEIESVNGASAILALLADTNAPPAVRARAVEAAGKIAAANGKDPIANSLSEAILSTLRAEALKGSQRGRDVVLMALTAALRTRPAGADVEVAKSLVDTDPRIRTDAANTLTRLKAKNARDVLRKLFLNDPDEAVRVNAARALGAAEDQDSLKILIAAASADKSPNVRISAIRALASLKSADSTGSLIDHGRTLLVAYKASRFNNPVEKSELLEVAAALGRLVPNTENEAAVRFLNEFRTADGFSSSETEAALARVAPNAYAVMRFPEGFAYKNSKVASAYAQGLTELAEAKGDKIKQNARVKLVEYISGMKTQVKPRARAEMMKAMPDLVAALAAFKPDNIDEILRDELASEDVFVRAAAATAIAGRPATNDNVKALSTSFTYAFVRDKHDNDAILAVLGATAKLDRKAASTSALMALNSPDYLVRKKGFEILSDKELARESPGLPTMVEIAREKHKDKVQPFTPAFGTKLGQMLSTDADYKRAVLRKNGTVKAVLTTEKGTFTINFAPEDAPLTVDNFITLARSGYFNGLEVHRVVPNFVMQDGDPRGDGNGGPGWSIRCEVNMLAFDRGAVGMALSGKDTGGSQWFVTHLPQPHLDGGYTVFGHISEADMNVVDRIVRGDRILTVKIIESRIASAK